MRRASQQAGWKSTESSQRISGDCGRKQPLTASTCSGKHAERYDDSSTSTSGNRLQASATAGGGCRFALPCPNHVTGPNLRPLTHVRGGPLDLSAHRTGCSCWRCEAAAKAAVGWGVAVLAGVAANDGTDGGHRPAQPKREQAVEVLSLHVFGLADLGGKLITRKMVAEKLAELSAHRDGCRCGLCELLPLVTVSKVWRMSSRWQTDVNRTRLLARR